MKKKNILKFSVMLGVAVILLSLDLTTKYIFDDLLADGSSLTVIPYLFDFRLVHNYGAAWGIMANKPIFLIILTFIFLAVFVVYYIKEPKKTWLLNISCAFILAGGLGNLYDRLVFGYVRDFIQFDFWKSFPIFNFADVALCVGVVLFVIYLLIYFIKNSKEKKQLEKKND